MDWGLEYEDTVIEEDEFTVDHVEENEDAVDLFEENEDTVKLGESKGVTVEDLVVIEEVLPKPLDKDAGLDWAEAKVN